jgi:HAD superfamily hydrolase (TIGR01484 family)
MSYLALATDYDGTIATEGFLDAETLVALQRWRDSDRRLILVTGRMLDDWLNVFSQFASPELFDWVVAENGAVLYHPVQQEVKLLATRPPEEFIQQLRDQIGDGSKIFKQAAAGEFAKLIQSGELASFAVGRVIVATWQPYEAEVEKLIQEMNLDLQVILNKRAVMVLPKGVDKAFGLKAALQELNLIPGQVVGVGDAENDYHFLDICGYSVAVANALPMLKARVDWVTTGARGTGVVELIDRLLGSGFSNRN